MVSRCSTPISCRELVVAYDDIVSCRRGMVLELLSLLLLLSREAPLGRQLVAQRLGIGERRARTLIARAAACGFILRDPVAGAVPVSTARVNLVLARLALKVVQADDMVIQVAYPLADEVLDIVEERIVRFRDHIVVAAGDSEAVEVIGVIRKGVPVFPGLVGPYHTQYVKLLKRYVADVDDGVVVSWRKYRRWVCEAILVSGLARLCRDAMGASG